MVASIAIQIHCLFAFFCTKLHLSSASASSRDIITVIGCAGSWACKCSGQAVKHSTIKCKSHVRLTPTVRPILRSEMRSQNSCSIRLRCSDAMLRSRASAVNWRPHALHLNLSRLNHRLPGRKAYPEVMQGPPDCHHEIADTRLPQPDPVFDDATAFDTTVDMLDAQPTLMQRLVGYVLLQRQLLAVRVSWP